MIRIARWNPECQEQLQMLAEVLQASVHAGASVSFILPFSIDDARTYWRDTVLPSVAAGERRVLIALADSRIVGTVQIDLDMPPNRQHRAAVMKLLVHPEARRQGIARALMKELENAARSEGRTLLT